MTKYILWKSKYITLSFKENINIYFFNNENTSYRKSYTSYYALEITSIGSHSSVKGS